MVKKKINPMIVIVLIIVVLLLRPSTQTVASISQLSGVTSTNNGHAHTYSVDIDGNGRTSFINNHEHEIFNFVVLEAHNHIHLLAR